MMVHVTVWSNSKLYSYDVYTEFIDTAPVTVVLKSMWYFRICMWHLAAIVVNQLNANRIVLLQSIIPSTKTWPYGFVTRCACQQGCQAQPQLLHFSIPQHLVARRPDGLNWLRMWQESTRSQVSYSRQLQVTPDWYSYNALFMCR